MKFFIDSANIAEIKEAVALGLCDGVTTNPSLVAKTGRPFAAVIADILDLVDGPVSLEVTALDYEGMMSQARKLRAHGDQVVVKLPLTKEGLKACKTCFDEGIATNLTLCFSPSQALLAAKAGAAYTRYADDLTFSFAEEPKIPLGRFFWWVDQICQAEGFTENTKTRRVYRRSSRQLVTGIVVNDGLTVPREVRRRLRAMLHRCQKEGLSAVATATGTPNLPEVLAGTAAYVQMVQPEAGKKLAVQAREVRKQGPK